MPEPNFFIAGAPKAGTTSLYHYLDQHPQIYLSPIKEPTFFAAGDFATHRLRDEMLRPAERDRVRLQAYLAGQMQEKRDHGLVLEWGDYLKLFRNVRDEVAIGEASVGYFWLEGAASAIAARLPASRIIIMLRDPADRMFSQYLASLASRPHRSFRDCFEAGRDPRNPESAWLEVGRYATHVGRFLDLFSRERVRVYLYDDFRADVHGTLRDMFAFLGVDPGYRVDVSRRHNQPRVPRVPALNKALRHLPGQGLIRRMLPTPAQGLAQALVYRDRTGLTMSQADRRLVIEHHRDEVERLQPLIGRDLAPWLTFST